MRNAFITILIIVAFAVAACDNDVVFYHYEPAPLAGWEKTDSMIFGVPHFESEGTYSMRLGVRTTNEFPFQSVCFVVDRKIFSKNALGKYYLSNSQSDTVMCHLTNEDGTVDGSGLNFFQYELPLNLDCSVETGDSLCFSVRHNMKRSILPGIADIGIMVRRNSGLSQP